MRLLPLAARLYVGAVIAVGGLLLTVYIPLPQDFTQPIWFVGLLLLSAVTSAFKVNLPLTNSGSTMSVSYAVDFLSLLLLGPHQTMLVAAASAWSQCTFRMSERNPVYRTLFSMSCLTVTVQVAVGFSPSWRHTGNLMTFGLLGMAKPLGGCGDVLPRQHRTDCHGHRPVDTPEDRAGLERELSLERSQLLRRRPRAGVLRS